MAELKEYPVKVNGYETVLQLTEKDAKARGLTESAPAAPETKAAKAPANKARAAANKSAE